MTEGSTGSERSEGTRDDLARVRSLYEDGKYVQAGEVARRLGPYRSWEGADARVLGASLARHLGAPRLEQGLLFRAYRDEPSHGRAVASYGRLLARRRGPYHGWRWLRRHGELPDDTPPEVRVLHYGTHGVCLALLRDFERAEQWLAAAEGAAGLHPWPLVEGSAILEERDLPEEALERCREAMRRRPWYRPAVVQGGHLLFQLERPEEALELLDGASAHLESRTVHELRAEILLRLERYESCVDALERAAALAPLAEPALRKRLHAGMAEAAYLARRHADAARHARASGSPATERFAARLEQMSDGEPVPRRHLAVPYVRQHHVTCAPASMASICSFYGDEVDHLGLAEEICYGGTPAHREREWAERRGLYVREFDVTPEAACALIDRGHPFTLTTVVADSAHLQVVTGYDHARESLLLRDPSTPHLVEMGYDDLREKHGWSGPRGMTMIPEHRAGEVADLELPAAARWDRMHAVRVALERHDPDAADGELQKLRQLDPNARLAHQAALAIASYRGDRKQKVHWLDRLLELYPGTPRLILDRAEAMRDLFSREERLAYLREHVETGPPALLETLAEELRLDGRQQEEAARLLRRALRIAPASAMAHHIYADLEAGRGAEPERALELYRFATHLQIQNEHFARAYFEHARRWGRAEEGLRWLEQRIHRARGRSAEPARTLFQVCLDLAQPQRGIAALQAETEHRPRDGELVLELVDAHLEVGELAQAEAALERAASLEVRRTSWLAAAARVASMRGDPTRRVSLLREATRVEPHDSRLHAELAAALDDTDEPSAAQAHLWSALEASPDDGLLVEELCIRLRGANDEEAEQLLSRRVARQSEDQWARRELALVLRRRGRTQEALEVAEQAVRWWPHDTWARSIHAGLLLSADRAEEARREARRAIEIDVDNDHAVDTLIEATSTREETSSELRFVFDRLMERQSIGTGAETFARICHQLPRGERMDKIRRLVARYPDLPGACEAASLSLTEAGELDEAEELLGEALARFPKSAGLLAARARVAYLRSQPEAERRWLTEALRISPRRTGVRLDLAMSLDEAGEHREARELVREGLRLDPRDPALRHRHLRWRWEDGELQAAFDELLEVTEGERWSSDGRFWTALEWADKLGARDRLRSAVQSWTERFPRSVTGPLRLAQLTPGPERVDEAVALLRYALELRPRLLEAADLIAVRLADAGRFDEALEQCPPPEWSGPVPIELRGRRAWVLARRGDLPAAMDAMRELLVEAPDYVWGRERLAEWYDESEQPEMFLAEARKLVASSPTDGVAYAMLGDALLQTGDRDGAFSAWERAVGLAPGHAHSVERLVELARAPGAEHARSQAAVTSVASHHPRWRVAGWRARVHARGGQVQAALAELDGMCDGPLGRVDLSAVLDELARAGQLVPALRIVERRFEQRDPAAPQELAAGWLMTRVRWRSRGALRFAARAASLGPAGQAALAGWLEELAEKGRRWAAGYVLLRHWRELRALAVGWGSAGFALLRMGLNWLTVRWLGDWRAREDVRQWMLLNLVIALWIRGQGADAGPVGERALQLPEDATAPAHRAWKALYEAMYADRDRAEALLEADREPALARDVVAVRRLTRALIEAERHAAASGREFSRAVRPHLDEARLMGLPSDAIYAKVLWRIAGRRPLWARAWWLGLLRWVGGP